ncbi:helix-turn-helix transcriptional regulator [Loktanella sp. Alg231-35]|uniref:helix-turn-helix transcriptional regulator n=1 Tax=Loktanella sp. Alg231-35 TaxID=1922220 RepID=UPI000D54E304|nr:helix-turn-helix transcriptional regulator [Loktanella sp. Alg231-35]
MRTQFSADLRLARRKAGYTQADVAALLCDHQSVVSELEDGTTRPDLTQIITLSLIYGRSFEAFFAEMMEDCTRRLKRRLKHLPSNVRQTVHTFNRGASLKALHERLANPRPHGSA